MTSPMSGDAAALADEIERRTLSDRPCDDFVSSNRDVWRTIVAALRSAAQPQPSSQRPSREVVKKLLAKMERRGDLVVENVQGDRGLEKGEYLDLFFKILDAVQPQPDAGVGRPGTYVFDIGPCSADEHRRLVRAVGRRDRAIAAYVSMLPTLDEPAKQLLSVANTLVDNPHVTTERPSARDEALDVLGYATRLAVSLQKKHYPEGPDLQALPDLYGVLTQIDNMTTGLSRFFARDEVLSSARRSSVREALEEAAKVVKNEQRIPGYVAEQVAAAIRRLTGSASAAVGNGELDAGRTDDQSKRGWQP